MIDCEVPGFVLIWWIPHSQCVARFDGGFVCRDCGRPQGSPLRWGIRNETENDATIDIGAGKAGRCLTPEHRYLHPVRPLIP